MNENYFVKKSMGYDSNNDVDSYSGYQYQSPERKDSPMNLMQTYTPSEGSGGILNNVPTIRMD